MYKETAGDYRIKYEGCFALLKKPPENTSPICVIEGVLQDDSGYPDGYEVSLYSRAHDNSTQHTIKRLSLDDIELTKLPTGCINTSKCVRVNYSSNN